MAQLGCNFLGGQTFACTNVPLTNVPCNLPDVTSMYVCAKGILCTHLSALSQLPARQRFDHSCLKRIQRIGQYHGPVSCTVNPLDLFIINNTALFRETCSHFLTSKHFLDCFCLHICLKIRVHWCLPFSSGICAGT